MTEKKYSEYCEKNSTVQFLVCDATGNFILKKSSVCSSTMRSAQGDLESSLSNTFRK